MKYHDRILTVFFGLLVFVVLASVALFMPQQKKIANTQSNPTISIAGVPLIVDVASTSQEREQGLSGRSGLPEGRGMLFVFPQDGSWGFWMKDMNFPIDIIWLDDAGRVVTIWPSLSPNSYPEVFYPTAPARYVLEVPAGFVASHQISAGAETTGISGL